MIKNIFGTFFIRCVLICLTFFSVPLLLKLFSQEQYGVWVTLTSLLSWITLFNFGIGYSLQNSVSRSISQNNFNSAKQEFLGYLKLLSIISIGLLIALIPTIYIVTIFRNHYKITLILFTTMIIIFPMSLGINVLQGLRKNALQSFLSAFNNTLFFIFLSSIVYFELQISLENLSFLFVSCAFISYALILRVSFRFLKIEHTDIINAKIPWNSCRVGLKFFSLQMSSLILYGLGNYLVYSFIGSSETARFDILNRIFTTGIGFFGLLVSNFWPEIVYNLSEKNFGEIKKLYIYLLVNSVVFTICAFTIAQFSDIIVSFWTGNRISISPHEASYFALLVSIQSFAYSGAVILNAYEHINSQIVLSLTSAMFLVPLSILFIRHGFGVSTIPFVASLLTLPALIYCNIKAYSLISNERCYA
ncbi:hypothetical protein DBB_4290 [Desulfoluna spongiiphila]|nr:hypothetical protein DBB_4290 [Desulfoluna spongiiphila]